MFLTFKNIQFLLTLREHMLTNFDFIPNNLYQHILKGLNITYFTKMNATIYYILMVNVFQS